MARKEEELVDLLQERARDRAALADKDMASQEQAGHPLLPPLAHNTISAVFMISPPAGFSSVSASGHVVTL